MIQWHFVVADDLVVEVGDVEGVVGAELEIDGTEPRIVAGDEVGLFVGFGRGTAEGDLVVSIALALPAWPFRPAEPFADLFDRGVGREALVQRRVELLDLPLKFMRRLIGGETEKWG